MFLFDDFKFGDFETCTLSSAVKTRATHHTFAMHGPVRPGILCD